MLFQYFCLYVDLYTKCTNYANTWILNGTTHKQANDYIYVDSHINDIYDQLSQLQLYACCIYLPLLASFRAF